MPIQRSIQRPQPHKRSRLLALSGWAAVLLLFLSSLPGCMTEEEWNRMWEGKGKGSQPAPLPRETSKSKAIRGTIGPLVTIEGMRMIQVRGFGLVMDLVDQGGTDGPEQVKKHLIKEIRRRQQIGADGFNATDIIGRLDTALVEVTGLVPAVAKKGDRFDVVVRALGTQTKSLVGGRLVLCDLKLYADTPGGVLSGETLATASGPVFVSPIGLGKEPPDKIDLRTGLVLGGGVTRKARRARLVLNDPSASIASRIVSRLNSRYATPLDPIATGRSPSFVDLTIPREYDDYKRIFLEQVLHTTLIGGALALERRSEELAKEIVHPDANHEAISVAWNSIGEIALPYIRPLYAHSIPATRFYAARAGLRMGDRRASDVIAQFAKDPGSEFRESAIDELGHATKLHSAGEALRALLNDSETWVRIRAYKALRRRPHPAIETTVLDQDNLILDVIDTTGPYLVYVQRAEQPRIALFGKLMRCRPPVAFPDPADKRDDRILLTRITADEGDEKLTLLYTNKRTSAVSPALDAPLGIPELIKFLGDAPTLGEDEIDGLAVPYSEIVGILHHFCTRGAIRAEFVPEDLTGRDESDIGGRRERLESEY